MVSIEGQEFLSPLPRCSDLEGGNAVHRMIHDLFHDVDGSGVACSRNHAANSCRSNLPLSYRRVKKS